jgi:hypothetical protein
MQVRRDALESTGIVKTIVIDIVIRKNDIRKHIRGKDINMPNWGDMGHVLLFNTSIMV